jgi:hypothetical protein
MLRAILAQFACSDQPLCAADVGRAPALQTSAVEGMLLTPVRAGRLGGSADGRVLRLSHARRVFCDGRGVGPALSVGDRFVLWWK